MDTSQPLQFTYDLAAPAVLARNIARQEGTTGRCIVCGAPATDKSAWWVEPLATDYRILWASDAPEELTEADTMGAQPLGPECAKKIPPAFRVR